MSRTKAYIAFGSNIGDGRQNITDAYEALGKVPGIEVLCLSEMFITKPWGYTDQPDFTNAACVIETVLSANALLGVCLGIEAAMGRIRQIKNGPRIIDLDLLTYGECEINSAELMLPHPGIKTRDFVLKPLEDLKSKGF